MPRSTFNKQVRTRKEFETRFLIEVLAAGAGVRASNGSISHLSKLVATERYWDVRDRLHAYFDSLKPFRRFGDFQGLDTLERPHPLELHVEPHILRGYFRAWLRQRRIQF